MDLQSHNGSLGVVVAVQVVIGQAVSYNLTVQDEHTFAVGQGHWVIHNTKCGVTNGETGAYSELENKSEPRDGLDLHHMPMDSYNAPLGIAKNDGFVVGMEHKFHRLTWTYKGQNKALLNLIRWERTRPDLM